MALFDTIDSGVGNSPGKYVHSKLSPPAATVDYSASPDEQAARQKFDEAANYQTKLRNSASAYRQNLPGTQNALMDQASDVGKRNLAQSIAQTKSNASSRGLLNSGIAQGAMGSNYTDYLSGLSSARAGINQETTQNAANMDNSAIQSGQQLQQQRQAMEDAIYGRQMQQYQNAQAKNEQNKGILGGFGSALGGAIGSKMGSNAGSS